MTVIMHERFGCKQYKLKGLKIWLSGHLYNKYFFDSMIDYLSENSINKVSVYRIKEILIKLRGNFSILIEGKDWVLASADRIRSFPIFYSKSNDFVIGNYAYDIKSFLSLKTCCPDKLSLLSFSMSGYTIGNRTLVKEVFQLTAGEFILVRNNKIYKELKELWSESQISIVDNILKQMEIDKPNRMEWFQALDIILKSKEKNVYEIIKKNTTTLS